MEKELRDRLPGGTSEPWAPLVRRELLTLLPLDRDAAL
jgi:hypothetical protein